MADKLKCMDTISQGVFIIGTRMNETYNFMTDAFVTQVSFNPCSIALSVDLSHYTAKLIQNQGQFSISVLAEGQELEAKNCGYQSGCDFDKAKRMKYQIEQNLPVIDGAASYMICKVKQSVVYEDHIVFFAEIVEGEYTDKKPMIYISKKFFP